jgi:hypothetical protein
MVLKEFSRFEKDVQKVMSETRSAISVQVPKIPSAPWHIRNRSGKPGKKLKKDC